MIDGKHIVAGDGAVAPRFRAFISYSHQDLAEVRRLHRQLEGFRIPERLVGTETSRGKVASRIRPIFRDVDELPATDDLSAEIKSAIAASEALIVVASPAAKASRWVNREIETFREIHGDSRPVLLALIDGEPVEAFPEAITAAYADPVAADFRKGGSGRRLALMKLVAGLTDLSLDSLVQRDAQRNLRRVTAITVASLIAVVIMALLLAAALRARSEANRQRTHAEGLVEYMLTDLRDRLKGVGRLDVMQAVNERAMTYYGQQGNLAELQPDSLDRRSRILHAMGEDDEKRGDLDAALAKFREAHRTTAAVLVAKPDDASAIFAHAQSEYWVGFVHGRRQEWKEAARQADRYFAGARRLIAIDPKNPDYMMEMGWGNSNVGRVAFSGRNDLAGARAHFLASITWYEKALLQRPRDSKILFSVANEHAWIADTYYGRREFKLSLDHRLKQYDAVKQIYINDKSNRSSQFRLASAEFALAKNYQKLKNCSAAVDWLDLAKSHAETIKLADPANQRWQVLHAKITGEYGNC